MRTKLARLFPAGWPWQRTLTCGGGALLVSWCVAVFYFLFFFNQVRENLRYFSGGYVPPFAQLFGRGLFCFWITALCVVLLPLFLYLWHWQGSKSIYLMRRLPRRSELWRRCLAGPAMLLVLTLLAAALSVLFCMMLYQALLPADCLPEDPWAGIGGILCWF